MPSKPATRRLPKPLLPALLAALPLEALAQALPALTSSPGPGGATTWSLSIQTLLTLTALTFIPAALLMMTGFTRIIIVFSLLRHALGTQTSPPNQVLVGLSLYTVTSIVCALAPTAAVLLVGRLLQGVAAGIQMPQVLGMAQELFQGRERGRAFGLFGATIGIATAFGPTLGGLLIALGGPTDGWRLIFWMNVPLCLAAIGLALWLLPDTRTRSPRPVQLDPIGVLLFGLSVISLMWPFLFTTGAPTDNPAHLLVKLEVAGNPLLARVTRYSAEQLGLHVGQGVWAQVKSVAVLA